MQTRVNDLLDEFETEEFDYTLNNHDYISDTIAFLRSTGCVQKLTFLVKNSGAAAELVINRIADLLEREYEDWDSALAAMLLVLIDANDPIASFVSRNILNHSDDLWWAKLLAKSYLLSYEFEEAS